MVSLSLLLVGLLQLRLLQDAIKREEDYLAEERRREIQARAEADEEAKCAYYLAKQEERETRLQQVRTTAYRQDTANSHKQGSA
jgi:hypothetical protein